MDDASPLPTIVQKSSKNVSDCTGGIGLSQRLCNTSWQQLFILAHVLPERTGEVALMTYFSQMFWLYSRYLISS